MRSLTEKWRLIICLLLMILAFVLINIGINHGETGVVEKKSTNICLECIGIG